MKRKQLRFGQGFRVAIDHPSAQAAEMVIPPGNQEGDPDNRHKAADQWLFVVSGTGRALVNGKSVPLKAGTLLLIEHKDRHEVQNTGRGMLKTLNFYCPRAYTRSGEELPAAQRPGT